MIATGFSAVLLISLSLFVLLNSEPSSNIEIDGKFSDWDESPMYSDVSDENNKHIDIIALSMDRDSIYLSFFVETTDNMFEGFGLEGDVVRIFIDTDSNADTGYAINWVGADYLIEAYGYENRILSSSYYEYDVNHRTESPRGQHDWNAWSSMFEVDSAVKGPRMEVQLWVDELNIPSGAEPRAFIQITDPRGNQDISTVFNSYGSLEAEIISKSKGKVSKGESEEFITLVLNNRGLEPVMVTDLTFTQDSTAVRDDIEKASLHLDGELLAIGSFDGKRLTFSNLELLIESFKNLNLELTVSDNAEAGHAVAFELTDIETDAAVTYTKDKVMAYIEEAPSIPVVDGLFGEWTDPESDELSDVSNPNVDISSYDARNHLDETYFYLKIEGNMLYGNAIPSTKAMSIPSERGDTAGSTASDESSQSTGTQKETLLPMETGEDAVYIFLDTIPEKGYKNALIEFGVDYMIEIKGIDGRIISARYYHFAGESSEDWLWDFVKTVEAASGLKEIETGVDAVPLNVYFHMVSWDEDEDWGNIGNDVNGIGVRYNGASFKIPAESDGAVIDGIKDAGDYETQVNDGTNVDIWAFYFNGDIYFWIEISADTQDESADQLEMYFEKDHGNGDPVGGQLEDGDEGFIATDAGTITDYLFQTGAWTSSGAAFDQSISFTMNGPDSSRSIEVRCNADDCGWSTPTNKEFAMMIDYTDSGDDTYGWPSDGDQSDTTIDHYGEVPEFHTIILPISSIFALVAIFERKRIILKGTK